MYFLSTLDTSQASCRKSRLLGITVLKLVCVTVLTTLIGTAQTPASAEFQKLSKEMTDSWRKGELDKALNAAERVAAMAAKENGKESPAHGYALRNIGMIAEAKGDQKRAEKSYEEAVSIFKKRRDTLTPVQTGTLADVLEGLGRIRARQDLAWSERIFKEALEIREKLHGPAAPETVTSLVQLASIAFWKRDFAKSNDLYGRSLSILSKAPKASGEDIALVYYRTQCSYRRAKIEDQFTKFRPIYDLIAGSPATPLTKDDVLNAYVIQEDIVNGKATYLQEPEWPSEARTPMAEGKVIVDVLINERGSVISACSRESKRHPAMLEASEIAAYKSRFTPTTVGGKSVKVFGGIQYTYRVTYGTDKIPN